MDLLGWMSGTEGGAGVRSGIAGMVLAQHAMVWPTLTILLSLLVATGYCAIAVNWFFQSKLARHAESRAALARLRSISLACAVSGLVLYWSETPWVVWRLYDLALLLLGFHAWSFVRRTRGLGLVDERLAQLDELERSATKYREIAELLPHMVWTATNDGRVDFSNQRWREYAGNECTWLEALHPDERQRVAAQWSRALAQREPVTMEARLRRGATGADTYRTFVIRATPIIRGAAVKWLGACADVEDQKQLAAEKEMQARQKSFFLNALSHDIRAPLHNVLLNAHLLRTSVRDEADVESVEMIVENAVAAGDLVTKLLDFARVGAQDHNDIERVELMPLLQQVVRRFQPIVEQKGLYLRLVEPIGAALDEVCVLSDRQKIERIISNLVDNAIKYTNQGGVTLDVRLRSRSDTGGAVIAGDGAVCVQVADSGVGVAPEHAPHLFDEFYQVNNYERDRSKGFGMGLAICRSLARHIGGDVRLAHTGPGGSCFELLVPAQGAVVGAGEPGFSHGDAGRAHGTDRGGRPGGTDGDREAAEAPGLCGV